MALSSKKQLAIAQIATAGFAREQTFRFGPGREQVHFKIAISFTCDRITSAPRALFIRGPARGPRPRPPPPARPPAQ